MDIPCTHSPGIQGDDLLFYAGDIPLVFGNQFRLKLPVAVTGDIDLEFTVLALEGLGGMAVSLIVRLEISLLLVFLCHRAASISASISCLSVAALSSSWAGSSPGALEKKYWSPHPHIPSGKAIFPVPVSHNSGFHLRGRQNSG